MADVLNKTSKLFLSSVNTPDYLDGNWLINPDMSVVAGLPMKYWLIEGETLRAATAEERGQIDLVDEYSGMAIEQVKRVLHSKINAYRDSYIDGGVIYMSNMFDSDDRARENILGMCSAISLGIEFPENFTWRTRNNEDVVMGRQALTQFGLSVLTFVSACFSVSWYHKDTITAMTSENIADYVAYDFTVGWPSKSLDGTSI